MAFLTMTEDNTFLAIQRQRIIREILEREGVVRNAELKQILKVSAVTIRADLRELESAGLCEIIWGGALYRPVPIPDQLLTLAERAHLNTSLKRRIGVRAAQFVEAGQTLLVDAGSTTAELINCLPPAMEYLRIVTAALNIAAAAAQFPYVELVMTGGVLRPLTRSLIGPQVLRALALINADIAFVGATGFDAEHGLTTSNILEVEVKRTMMEQASRVIVMADSSKCGTVLSLTVAPFSAVDTLITDTGLHDADAEAIEQTGVTVIRV
jgi:DeoR/GlpR family transcriptional regulator of sugar metabolism